MSEFFQIRFERWLGAASGEITHLQMLRAGMTPCWTPPVNVYRCARELIVCVDLAGVKNDNISVQAEPRRLRIRGHRPPPEPRPHPNESLQVLAMEIDYGRFERELILPDEIDPDRTVAEQRDGWLWIRLPLKSQP